MSIKKAYEFVKDAGSFLRGSMLIGISFFIFSISVWNTILMTESSMSHREMRLKIDRFKNEAKLDRKFFIQSVNKIFKKFVVGEPITKNDKITYNEKQKQWLRVGLGLPAKK